ncbi:uncharacterized protein TRIVIDRAFT_222624 [Trichoderma virens Gv29-8]|uniref:Uncharacterized protein n=1 Tax=Hypocrea virens (strain Gv29-8 / FGSC 10586) TaxID=413071 RepID=G9MUG4_HYPVG|nr:uncharacterized protein TRIVIDRAFT_222624 [Trichoderma virens Gv29-8]EHK21908.1 hypothetical protein TRIVIDRAFT_222624 [Trichoderma virens Gv29-8]UKZ54357.1 hypothetical protein TrVGV298_008165 [Trichoderma virens]
MEPGKPKAAFSTPPDFTKKPALFKQGKDDLIFIIGQQVDAVDIVSYEGQTAPYCYQMATAKTLLTWANYIAKGEFWDASQFWTKSVKLLKKGAASHPAGKADAPEGYMVFERASRIVLMRKKGTQIEEWAVIYARENPNPGYFDVLRKIGKQFLLVPKLFWGPKAKL